MFIELLKGKRKWFWHLKGKNGEVVLSSQGYRNRWSAKRSASKFAYLNDMPLKGV